MPTSFAWLCLEISANQVTAIILLPAMVKMLNCVCMLRDILTKGCPAHLLVRQTNFNSGRNPATQASF